ncbi:MAG: SCP2 sterol-binding domain-containing protein [Deltaproteobacteria bacterium]|jgi:putative sterol carrier protein|nr:SCP2 sterol-binding domain-containing protein [Deltaproteobacteria bacterium]
MTLEELYHKMIDKASRTKLDSNIKASILLNITDEQQKQWLVDFNEGVITVNLYDDSEPDVTVTTNSATLLKVAQRQMSPMMAFITGKIKVKGDANLVGQLKNVWPD